MISLLPPAGPLRVLFLGAHPDDIEIGCGGTLLTLARRPETTVSTIVLTGDGGRRDEARAAAEAFFPGTQLHLGSLPDGRLPAEWLEAKQTLEQLAADQPKPEVVFAPRVDDAHQDHRLLGLLASTVWRDSLILHYEIPKWDGDLGAPTHYVSLSPDVARRKVELLNQVYPSQLGRDWWDDELFMGLMRVRGIECRSRYAEAFFCTKVTVAFSEEPA